MAPPRILLCGDVFGRLNQLVKRILSVNKSAGPFDAVLCVGQFFPDSPEKLQEFMDYIEGRSQIPLPTYFIGDYGIGAPKVLLAASRDSANLGFKMDGLRICDNLYWLKGSGKFTLHGLYVAYISGRQSLDGQQFGTYSQDDVAALRALADEPGIVDLFLTNEWPTGVTKGAVTSNIPPGISDSSGSDSTISELVGEIKPRYHIAGTKGIFYDREPYSNLDAVHVTRFLGLAPVGNKDKQAVPIPLSRASAVKQIFILAAEKLGFQFVTIRSDNDFEGRKLLRAQFDDKFSFFYVELPDGTILSHAIEENEKFPAQFGREVLAGLLNMADRADWRNCKQSKEDEMKVAENFKNQFKKFDPNQ